VTELPEGDLFHFHADLTFVAEVTNQAAFFFFFFHEIPGRQFQPVS
jgi:hypothetical protein